MAKRKDDTTFTISVEQLAYFYTNVAFSTFKVPEKREQIHLTRGELMGIIEAALTQTLESVGALKDSGNDDV